MLGLAILFGLFVWLIMTIFATIIGYETGKKFGAFIGFMLTMGGWIVYWILEYHYIQHKVNHLCKTEGGVTVYITPEEWRKMIGEEEWRNLKPLTNEEINERYQKNTGKILFFEGVKYRLTFGQMGNGNIENNRLTYYDYSDSTDNIPRVSSILVDESSQKILVKRTYFSHTKTRGYSFFAQIRDCSDSVSANFHTTAVKYSYQEH